VGPFVPAENVRQCCVLWRNHALGFIVFRYDIEVTSAVSDE
jgi:hypothetical protein